MFMTFDELTQAYGLACICITVGFFLSLGWMACKGAVSLAAGVISLLYDFARFVLRVTRNIKPKTGGNND